MNYTLITGATGGLGKAFTLETIKRTNNLFLTSTSAQKLENLKTELLKINKDLNIITFTCDLSNEANRKELFKYIKDNNIYFNFLINNAGFITEGSIKNSTNETLLKCIKVNCEGVIDLTKFIIDRKEINKQLNIINISSLGGEYSMPYMAIYSATKAFETNFMTSLRIEYKHENVKVLIVKPGAIPTSKEMKESIKSQGLKGKLSSVKPEIIAKNSIKKSLKNKKSYVPGFFNKLTLFLSFFVSNNLKAKFIKKIWLQSQAKRSIK